MALARIHFIALHFRKIIASNKKMNFLTNFFGTVFLEIFFTVLLDKVFTVLLDKVFTVLLEMNLKKKL